MVFVELRSTPTQIRDDVSPRARAAPFHTFHYIGFLRDCLGFQCLSVLSSAVLVECCEQGQGNRKSTQNRSRLSDCIPGPHNEVLLLFLFLSMSKLLSPSKDNLFSTLQSTLRETIGFTDRTGSTQLILK